MKAAVAIPVHELESPLALRVTAASFLEQGAEVFIVIDTPLVYTKFSQYVPQEVKWLVNPQPGLGAARNLGLSNLAKAGYDCVATADSHVVLLDGIDELCRDALAGGGAQGLRIDVNQQQLLTRTPSSSRPWFGRMYSISLARYVEVYSCEHKPWTYEPLTAYSGSALRRLMEIQSGVLILGRGYGAESPDLSMSLARLGYKIMCSPTRYLHRFSTGQESFWKDRWNDEQNKLFRESFGVYLYKHVPKEKWRASPYETFVREVKPWQMALADRFNSAARMSTEQVYKLFLSTKFSISGSPNDLLA
jgi:glycosyltransferase involved in cell wall biosynthesis